MSNKRTTHKKIGFFRYLEALFRIFRNWVYIRLIFPLIGRKQKRKKYYVSLCVIFKNEDKFFKEFIEYYKLLGVDHFYMYNNNSDDKYEKVLKPYIKEGSITLIDWPQKPGQMSSYNDCIKRFSHETNWIGFIDVDEFICPIRFDSIPEWLEKYQKLPCTWIFWKLFSSSGRIKEDLETPVIEQFYVASDLIRSSKIFLNTDWSAKVNNFKTPHAIRFKFWGPVVQEHADLLFGLINDIKDDSKLEIQMNHYTTKSYDYFVTNKTTRGDVLKDHQGCYPEEKFFGLENYCYKSDYHIFKYLIKLKLRLDGRK
jgi:hypothetical protein